MAFRPLEAMERGLRSLAPERDPHIRFQGGRHETNEQGPRHGVQRCGDRGKGRQEAVPLQDEPGPARRRGCLRGRIQGGACGVDLRDTSRREPDVHPGEQAQADAGEQHPVQGVQRHRVDGGPDNTAPPHGV